MTEPLEAKPVSNDTVVDREISSMIGKKAMRKLDARHKGQRSAWLGLGMMGLVGWSVVLPILGFAALGIWLDSRYPGPFPWTLYLLMAGVAYGCFYGWYWIKREAHIDTSEPLFGKDDSEDEVTEDDQEMNA